MEDELFCVNCDEPAEPLLEGFYTDCYCAIQSEWEDLKDAINWAMDKQV